MGFLTGTKLYAASDAISESSLVPSFVHLSHIRVRVLRWGHDSEMRCGKKYGVDSDVLILDKSSKLLPPQDGAMTAAMTTVM